MPIYEYRCSDCGQQKDHLQKVSDAPLDTCPACGGKNYAKALTAAGFQLKGSGWYATDFKGGSSTPAKTADASPESSPKTDTPASTSAETTSTASGGSCNPGCACH